MLDPLFKSMVAGFLLSVSAGLHQSHDSITAQLGRKLSFAVSMLVMFYGLSTLYAVRTSPKVIMSGVLTNSSGCYRCSRTTYEVRLADGTTKTLYFQHEYETEAAFSLWEQYPMRLTYLSATNLLTEAHDATGYVHFHGTDGQLPCILIALEGLGFLVVSILRSRRLLPMPIKPRLSGL